MTSSRSNDDKLTAPRGDWIGSLVTGQQDATGLMYRRSRYYNPATGQFTQSDPIGIAGGLNTYGFANGDPVGYGDPYGLRAQAGCCTGFGAYDASPPAVEQEVQRSQWAGQHPGQALALVGVTLVGAAVGLIAPEVGAGLLARFGARAAPAAAAAGAAGAKVASRVPWEGFQEWGRTVVQWGRGAPDALERAGEFTVEQAATIDPRKVDMARQFYEDAVANGRGGEAAVARVELMKRIAELQQR